MSLSMQGAIDVEVDAFYRLNDVGWRTKCETRNAAHAVMGGVGFDKNALGR